MNDPLNQEIPIRIGGYQSPYKPVDLGSTFELRWASARTSGRFLVALVNGSRMAGSWSNIDEAVVDLTTRNPDAVVLLPPVA